MAEVGSSCTQRSAAPRSNTNVYVDRVTLFCIQDKHSDHSLALNKEGYSCYSVHRLDQALFAKWVPDNTSPYVLQMVQGFWPPLIQIPIQRLFPPEVSVASDQIKLIMEEVEELKCKGAISPAYQAPGTFVSQLFLVPKKDRVAPCNKYKGTEQIYSGGSLQDGVVSHSERTTPGLANESRSKGCVLFSPNSSRPPQIPPVSMGGPDVQACFLPIICSKNYYKVGEASGDLSEGKRNETGNVSGGYAGGLQFTEGRS